MKRITSIFLLTATAIWAQAPEPVERFSDHLTETEITAAENAKPGTGKVEIVDSNLALNNALQRTQYGHGRTVCGAQLPGVIIVTPEGQINYRSTQARKQFLPYTPSDWDTERLLTIDSFGCAGGPPVSCVSLTRTVLMSSDKGGVTVEAVENKPYAQEWQNAFGATASCNGHLVSRFTIDSLQKVQDSKGEFYVAIMTADGVHRVFKVKEKHVKQLALAR
jgi:hypothetical protein